MPKFEMSDIVECYPTGISVDPSLSEITVNVWRFKRFVYRPYDGPDVLVSQIPGMRGYVIKHTTDRYFQVSKEELRGHISYDLADYDKKNWVPFATKMAAYVCDEGCEGDHFKLYAYEVIGELYVMDEADGWPYMFPKSNTANPDAPCSICIPNPTDEVRVRMGLRCGHVFHKDCLTERIWFNPTCPNPNCGAPI